VAKLLADGGPLVLACEEFFPVILGARRWQTSTDQRPLMSMSAQPMPSGARKSSAASESLSIVLLALPGSRQRLIEIIDVEDHSPFRRRESPEIQQMTIAASAV
jgi:hypothetical protein